MMTATHPAPKGKKAQRFTRVDEDTMENIDKVLGDLRSSDYRLRWAGLDLLSQLVLSHNKTSSVAVHINKVAWGLSFCFFYYKFYSSLFSFFEQACGQFFFRFIQ